MVLKIKKSKNYLIALLAIVIFVVLGSYLKENQRYVLSDMKVIVTAKVPKDDIFQLFYWEKSEPKFKIENSIRTNVKAEEGFQEIFFQLPKITDLYRLRLDIGENADQGTVEIEQIKFIKEDEELVFKAADFNRLFVGNEYVVKNGTSGFDGKAKVVNGRSIYDPYFVSVDGSEEMNAVRIDILTHFPYVISAFICLVLFLFAVYNVKVGSVTRQGFFITAFFTILLLPTVQNEIQFTEPLENLEKRELAKMPQFAFTAEFARNFEDYYNDNFGLRNNLINWGGTYRTKLFRASMHPELVMFGKDKWLFYNKVDSRMYRSYSRSSPLSRDRTKKIVDQWMSNKKRYEADGREYFLAFWPNKHSIYPEFLPNMMKIQIKDTPARADQLIEFIEESGVPLKFTDVRPALLKNKGDKLLYHKFDSHWNDYGAFLAYEAFFEQNKELGMKPKTEEDFDIKWVDYSQGELIQMLGVRNKGFFIEKNPKFTLLEHKDQIEYLPIDGFPKLTVITKNKQCGNKKRALIFRDSFTNSLIQFFSLHFYEVYYIWGHHEEYVEKLQPDVIIDGFVEREIGEKVQ